MSEFNNRRIAEFEKLAEYTREVTIPIVVSRMMAKRTTEVNACVGDRSDVMVAADHPFAVGEVPLPGMGNVQGSFFENVSDTEADSVSEDDSVS